MYERDLNRFAYILKKELDVGSERSPTELSRRSCSILFRLARKSELTDRNDLPAIRLAVRRCVTVIDMEIAEVDSSLAGELSDVMHERKQFLLEAKKMAQHVGSHCPDKELAKLGEASDYIRVQMEELREDMQRSVSRASPSRTRKHTL